MELDGVRIDHARDYERVKRLADVVYGLTPASRKREKAARRFAARTAVDLLRTIRARIDANRRVLS